MSRIGKLPIAIPAGVTVTVSPENVVTVKGPKGELSQAVDPLISVKVEGAECHVTRPNDEKEARAKHGLYRALIHNMVVGCSEGYKKTLELVGVGYRVELAQPQVLNFSLGYTHPIYLGLPKEVKVETIPFQLPPSLFTHLFIHQKHNSFRQVRIAFGQLVQQHIHGLVIAIGQINFDIIIHIDAEVKSERADNSLEKAVNCADGKIRIIVQNLLQQVE